jgi:hypothetical protein
LVANIILANNNDTGEKFLIGRIGHNLNATVVQNKRGKAT